MINKVILIGNVGNEPDVRKTNDGKSICNFSVATTERWKKDGETHERTEWHRIVAFEPAAKFVEGWISKGTKVYIEGKLQTRKWQDQSGQDRYSTEVVISGYGTAIQALNKVDRKDADPEQSSQEGQIYRPDDLDDEIPF